MPLASVRAAIFDLDGTLYCGEAPVPGAAELLEFLAGRRVRIFFCTNNSSQTREQISAKLNALKLPASPEAVYSAAYGAARYLREEKLSGVYCFGSAGLAEELRRLAVETVPEPEQAALLLIGLDSSFDYRRIASLIPLRGKPLRLVTCNRDKFFPSDHGLPKPGCGFIATVVEQALERRVDYCIGKPNSYLLELLMSEHGLTRDQVVMVGDSLESDIAMARAAGCRSVLLRAQQQAPMPQEAVSQQETFIERETSMPQQDPGLTTVGSLFELRSLFS